MFEKSKKMLIRLSKKRVLILMLIFVVLFVVLLGHLFGMQIINGEEYQKHYAASIQKTLTVPGIRGNIYDRNGVVLAYNELTWDLTLEDSGVYADTEEKNRALNAEINSILDILEDHGDSFENTLHIVMDPADGDLSFDVSGSALTRFRADVFGYAKTSDLSYNRKLKIDERRADADQIYAYLLDRYGVDGQVYADPYRAWQIVSIRYALGLNSFQKYLSTTIARDISDESAASIREHADTLIGSGIVEDTRRVYTHPECFSGIVGYTGTISTEEYEALSEKDDSYTLTDRVGKSGIEQMMEEDLRGVKGSQKVYVNNVGRVLEVLETSPSKSGNDVYLSIDANLQQTVYDLLEKEIAGILYASLQNVHQYKEDEGHEFTPVYDVYKALLTNNVIHLSQLARAGEGTAQARIYQTFSGRQSALFGELEGVLKGDEALDSLSDAMQDLVRYIVEMLQTREIFDKEAVDASDPVYRDWKKGRIPVADYLKHAIDQGWIDVNSLDVSARYADTDLLYAALVDWITEAIQSDSSFDKIIYAYLVLEDEIRPLDICLALYEQGILEDDSARERLEQGSLGPYDFVRAKIRSLEIKPGQLGLDPCSGSCVLMDPRTGSLLACVSYPGYDANRLAAGDSAYYQELLTNASSPLYNNATQQKTAPGSTFKPLTALAALTDGTISTDTSIRDEGVYTRLDMKLKCWIYPGNHGEEDVVSAIKDSCNYFFCETGYRMSLKNGRYNEETGLERIGKYAAAFGLASKTGIEIPETESSVASEYPISAAIGQSNNAYTTVALARYVSALANRGTVYKLTVLDHIASKEGQEIKRFLPETENLVTDVSAASYQAVREGMRQVVASHSQFDDIRDIRLAGKTGTAEEAKNRPNHALFIGYAPYNDPEIAIAARIAHGHSSANTCDFADDVMKYYFGMESAEKLLEGGAATVTASNSITD